MKTTLKTDITVKDDLLARLNKVSTEWIDGDLNNKSIKTADMVNHKLKIAIEIKDDTKSKPPRMLDHSLGTYEYDLSELNKRFYADIKNANKKFRNYPGYKTVLLLRTEVPRASLVAEAILGIHTFSRAGVSVNENLTYKGRRGKHNRCEVGCFLIFCGRSGLPTYFSNGYASKTRILNQEELETHTGFKLERLN